MDFFNAERMKKYLLYTSSALITALLLYLFLHFLLPALLPFILSFLTVICIRPAINVLNRKFGIAKKPMSLLIFLLIFVLLIAVFLFIADRVISELRVIAAYVTENSEKIGNDIMSFFNMIGDRLPFLEKITNRNGGEYVLSLALGAVENKLAELASAAPDEAIRFFASMPDIILFVIVFVSSVIYACAEYDKVSDKLGKILPAKALNTWRDTKAKLKRSAFRYLRACFLIIFITFSELLCGFLLLGMEYSFLPALIISLIDILPVLGVGTVLIPWALILLLFGNYYTGMGLLIMYAVITVVRQAIEPHIIGMSIGTHPLLMLFSTYTGYKLFGIPGLIILPLSASVIYGLAVPDNGKEKGG